MKLIIDIPKEMMEALEVGNFCSKYNPYELCWRARNGIPLDDVKADIKRMEYHMIDCDVLVSQEEVLEILDNIGKENKNNC